MRARVTESPRNLQNVINLALSGQEELVERPTAATPSLVAENGPERIFQREVVPIAPDAV
jgi:hypothetical protein